MSESNIFIKGKSDILSYFRYSERLDPVLALRGLACLIVIWNHTQEIRWWLVVHGINLSFLVFPSGFVAVQIFYLISGYSVGYGFFSKKYTLSIKSLRSFYINRWLRIAPAYYVCILASMFIFYRQTATSLSDILRFFTFTANFDNLNLPFQLPLVIISTEMQFYLIAPMLFGLLSSALRRIHPFVVGIYILCFGFAVRYMLLLLGLISDFDMYRLNVYVKVWGMIDFFLFGMFLSCMICERRSYVVALKNRITNLWYAVVLIGWSLWMAYTHSIDTGISWPQEVVNRIFILPFTLCIVIGWYILSSSVDFDYKKRIDRISHIIKLLVHPKTFLSGIGFISYGLYLYHYAFFEILYSNQELTPHFAPNVSRFVIVLSITIITALASYTFVESPLLRKKIKKL